MDGEYFFVSLDLFLVQRIFSIVVFLSSNSQLGIKMVGGCEACNEVRHPVRGVFGNQNWK